MWKKSIAGRAAPSKENGPGSPEPLGKSRGAKHSVDFSIGEANHRVKLLEEIISAFSPPMELSSTIGRMDPAGLEPASATVTECCVRFTPRALSGVFFVL